MNKTGARQYTRALSPTLGLPTRFMDALNLGFILLEFPVGKHTSMIAISSGTGFRFALVFTCTFTECVT